MSPKPPRTTRTKLVLPTRRGPLSGGGRHVVSCAWGIRVSLSVRTARRVKVTLRQMAGLAALNDARRCAAQYAVLCCNVSTHLRAGKLPIECAKQVFDNLL